MPGIRAMDTAEGYELVVGQADRGVSLVLDDFSARKFMGTLTAAEARNLAEILIAAAGESELEDEPVAMVCTACRKPAQPTRHGQGWQHSDVQDSLSCPRLGSPVTVMVAAGNEKIPFDLAKPAMSVQLDA